jgi:hypothetical protein
MAAVQIERLKKIVAEDPKAKHLEVREVDGAVELRSSPSMLLVWPAEVWEVIGAAVKAAEQPWWDFVIRSTDNVEYARKVGITDVVRPNAHAVTIVRVHDSGLWNYLWLQEES